MKTKKIFFWWILEKLQIPYRIPHHPLYRAVPPWIPQRGGRGRHIVVLVFRKTQRSWICLFFQCTLIQFLKLRNNVYRRRRRRAHTRPVSLGTLVIGHAGGGGDRRRVPGHVRCQILGPSQTGKVSHDSDTCLVLLFSSYFVTWYLEEHRLLA